jgi:serine/threonine protein kinase
MGDRQLMHVGAEMIGEIFGNYEVVASLGKGGMGVVYLGQHQRIARRAAIKVLAPELTRNPEAVRRFFIEARATSLIKHDGIVEVFDCDVDLRGRAYIVMEHLEGETLAAHLARSGALPWRTTCVIGRRIAEAVDAAHASGIVHRDLKPENIFVTRDPAQTGAAERAVKILDFGIAKLLSVEARAEGLTRAGVLLGTPRYISPEQCCGDGDVDHRADIYSLGCILFEMMCGQPLFAREQVRALLAAHMFQRPPAASERVPSIPAWLDHLVTRMLAKLPDERPASMSEVARALSAGDDGQPQRPPKRGAPPSGRPSGGLLDRAPPRVPPSTKLRARRPPTPRSAAIVSIVGFAVVFGATAALEMARWSGPVSRPPPVSAEDLRSTRGHASDVSKPPALSAPAPPIESIGEQNHAAQPRNTSDSPGAVPETRPSTAPRSSVRRRVNATPRSARPPERSPLPAAVETDGIVQL